MGSGAASWVDGVRSSTLPLPDRALSFGDGLFETLLLRAGRPLFPEQHRQRLQRGASTLLFPDVLPRFDDQLQQVCDDAAVRAAPWSSLRITVSRGPGPRGYAPPAQPQPRLVAQWQSLPRDASQMLAPATVGIADVRWGAQPALAGIKHLNRLEQVLAAAQCAQHDWDEALMLDQAGRPLSVSAGNLFAIRQGRLSTPPLQDCGIAGTRRALLLQRWAPAVGLEVREATLSLDELRDADELFYSNALVTLRPIARLADQHWREHPVCEALFARFVRSPE